MRHKTVVIDGVTYLKAEGDKQFVIVRSYGAGVFAGFLAEKTVAEIVSVKLDRCIRLHAWTGCSLSQVANDGIAGNGENRFSMATDNHEIFNVIEIIPCTEKARIAIQGVRTWEK